jgi:hypothetical protein
LCFYRQVTTGPLFGGENLFLNPNRTQLYDFLFNTIKYAGSFLQPLVNVLNEYRSRWQLIGSGFDDRAITAVTVNSQDSAD